MKFFMKTRALYKWAVVEIVNEVEASSEEEARLFLNEAVEVEHTFIKGQFSEENFVEFVVPKDKDIEFTTPKEKKEVEFDVGDKVFFLSAGMLRTSTITKVFIFKERRTIVQYMVDGYTSKFGSFDMFASVEELINSLVADFKEE